MRPASVVATTPASVEIRYLHFSRVETVGVVDVGQC